MRSGADLQIARLAVDTGYEAPAVYAWARAQGFAQVAPVKGVEGFNRASPVSGPTYVDATVAGKRLRRGARLWTVAVSTFKAETYRFLRLERPTAEDLDAGAKFQPGTIHLPDWVEIGVAEAVRRRAAGHGEDEARFRPARMAEASGEKRGARHSSLRARRRLDRRTRPLVRRALGRGRARGLRRNRTGAAAAAGREGTGGIIRGLAGPAAGMAPIEARLGSRTGADVVLARPGAHLLTLLTKPLSAAV